MYRGAMLGGLFYGLSDTCQSAGREGREQLNDGRCGLLAVVALAQERRTHY